MASANMKKFYFSQKQKEHFDKISDHLNEPRRPHLTITIDGRFSSYTECCDLDADPTGNWGDRVFIGVGHVDDIKTLNDIFRL